MSKVLIVGAGISGLSVAFRLQQLAPGLTITVLEQNNRSGGKIWTERLEGFQVETGPNGFLDTKPSTLALCRDLGLESRLVPASEAAKKNRYLFLDGRLRPLPASLSSFLRSDLLSWRGKLNLLLERFRRALQTGDESIADFARRRAGREVAEVLVDALVTGIHAGDPALLSAPAAFPRLTTLEREHGSILKGLAQASRQRRAQAKARGEPDRRPGTMWSLREGLRQVVEKLCDKLRQPPLLGISIRSVRTGTGDGSRPSWEIKGEGQDSWTADAVILACPAYQQAAMLADLDRDLADLVGGIAYNRVAVVALGYRLADLPHRPEGFGYIAPQRTRRDVLGVQWCSSIYPERAPAGMCLLRALCGGWHRAEVAGWEESRLVQAVRDDLRQAMHITAAPVFQHLVRWDRAIPQYHLGHLDRLARINARAARFPGLFLAGNAFHGIALNDCTEQGERLAQAVQDYLAR
jgi:oxygen-dependent protoporphyrinogen oxidase